MMKKSLQTIIIMITALLLLSCAGFPEPKTPEDTLLIIDIGYSSEKPGTTPSSLFGFLEANVTMFSDPTVMRSVSLNAEKDYVLVQGLPPGQYHIPEVYFVFKESSKKQPAPTISHTFSLQTGTATICPIRFTYSVKGDGSIKALPDTFIAPYQFDELVSALSENEGWSSWKLQKGAGDEVDIAVDLLKRIINDNDKSAVSEYISHGVLGNINSKAGYSMVLMKVVGADHEPVSEQVEMAKKLLEAGADPNEFVWEIEDKEYSLLDMTIVKNNIDLGKVLIEYGADVNKVSPLEISVKAASDEFLQVLLKSGADPNIANDRGQTALMFASVSGSTEMIKLLLDAGADTNIQDPNGWSPLLIAIGTGQIEPVRILLEAGADLDVQSSDGFTPVSLAEHNGEEEIVQLLLKYSN